jgi:hypothetical protein
LFLINRALRSPDSKKIHAQSPGGNSPNKMADQEKRLHEGTLIKMTKRFCEFFFLVH